MSSTRSARDFKKGAQKHINHRKGCAIPACSSLTERKCRDIDGRFRSALGLGTGSVGVTLRVKLFSDILTQRRKMSKKDPWNWLNRENDP